MESELNEMIKNIQQYSDNFPRYFDSFLDLINKNIVKSAAMHAFLSKDYEVKTIKTIENGISTTKVEKQVSKLSLFIFTKKHIFEFELRPELTRYDVILINTTKRIEVLIKEEILILNVSHGLGSVLNTKMSAYTEAEKRNVLEIKEFLFKKLTGDEEDGE